MTDECRSYESDLGVQKAVPGVERCRWYRRPFLGKTKVLEAQGRTDSISLADVNWSLETALAEVKIK